MELLGGGPEADFSPSLSCMPFESDLPFCLNCEMRTNAHSIYQSGKINITELKRKTKSI